MSWSYGRCEVEHPLPVGVSRLPSLGQAVRAGEALAAGSAVGGVTVVQGARRLGVPPEDLDAVTRVRTGTEVDRGAVLARTGRRFARASIAPIDGRLVHRTAEGDFYIAPPSDGWVVRSAMDGVVTRAGPASVTVEGTAWTLAGIAAYGPDAIGELALGVDGPGEGLAPARVDVRLSGKILIGGSRLAAEAITRAHACGVAGLVAGAAPAGGLRVVYGPDVTARGLVTREDRPTVLCLMGYGSAVLPDELYQPLRALAGSRAAIHTASLRLLIFAGADAAELSGRVPTLALADDYSGVRPFADAAGAVDDATFPSEARGPGISAADGTVPLANVMPYDARR